MKHYISEKDMIKLKIIVPIVLILLALFFIVYNYKSLVKNFEEGFDKIHLELAHSIDRNIAAHLDHCKDSMEYVTNRRGFVEAEKDWIENGNAEDLLFRLKENLTAKDEMIQVILAEKDGAIFLSTDERLDYSLLYHSDNEDIAYYETSDGQVFIGLIVEKSNDLRYIALLNPKILYAAANVNDDHDNGHLILADEQSRIIIVSNGNTVDLMRREDIINEYSQGLGFLKDSQKSGEISIMPLKHSHLKEDISFDARVFVLPTAQSENGVLVIVWIGNFDGIVLPLIQISAKMSICCISIVCSMVYLLYVLDLARLRQKKELELLWEKNRVMKELNQQREELAHHQRLELIGTMTAGVAHEFNNLLTPIMGYSLMALEHIPEDNAKATDQLLKIYESSRKAKDITRRLSDISRKNNREFMTAVNINHLLQTTLEIVQPVRPSFVDVNYKMPEEKIHVLGDTTRLTQLFLNLFVNAFHAMAPSGGVLSIGVELIDSKVKIKVEDTGCGIPPEILPNIFGPFVTTKENQHGTGLGLAIVQQVVSEHDGRIDVKSEVGKGTVFTVYLPMMETGETIPLSP